MKTEVFTNLKNSTDNEQPHFKVISFHYSLANLGKEQKLPYVVFFFKTKVCSTTKT